MKKNIFIFMLLLVGSISLASINENINTQLTNINKKSSQLGVNLKDQNEKILQITEKIKQLEGELDNKNREYIDLIESKKNLDVDLEIANKELEDIEIKIDQIRKSAQAVLNSIIVGSLNKFKDETDIVIEQMLSAEIVRVGGELDEYATTVADKKKQIDSLQEKNNQIDQTCSDIELTIKNMEQEKQTQANEYVNMVNERDNILENIDNGKLQKKLVKESVTSGESNGQERFESPIKTYSKLDYNKTGITYKISGVVPIYAGESGKVVYQGALSTYGNLIIINHGDDFRSVTFGDFVAKIKKGDEVTKGDILGYTTNKTSPTTKIYFEVRIKDKAQNTIKFLDRRSLTSNSIL